MVQVFLRDMMIIQVDEASEGCLEREPRAADLSPEQLGRTIGSTFPIRSQAQQGEWDFELKSVYTVGILGFVFDEDKGSDQVFHHEVQLFDKSVQAVFYDKLTYIFLEIPKFTKTIDELYVLKNLEHLTDRPAKLQESLFTRIFEQAKIANFDDKEYSEYEESLKTYRDLKN